MQKASKGPTALAAGAPTPVTGSSLIYLAAAIGAVYSNRRALPRITSNVGVAI